MSEKVQVLIETTLSIILALILGMLFWAWYATETHAYGVIPPQAKPPSKYRSIETNPNARELSQRNFDQLYEKQSQTASAVEIIRDRVSEMDRRSGETRTKLNNLSELVRQDREHRITMLETNMENILLWFRTFTIAVIGLIAQQVWIVTQKRINGKR